MTKYKVGDRAKLKSLNGNLYGIPVKYEGLDVTITRVSPYEDYVCTGANQEFWFITDAYLEPIYILTEDDLIKGYSIS